LNTFFNLMATEPARAFYGLKHIEMANEHLAIETLLLSDSLFRSNDIKQRKKYVNLVESIKEQGANVLIFSSMHPSGEQLSLLSGIAAILKFPLHELEDEDMSDSDDADENNESNKK
uniref:Putative pelota (inferred by orthology to a S. mansoni protein) n=1 Tax=Anisakis simplex TaxID=6269 RepID=A0A0M3K9S5_ANISI